MKILITIIVSSFLIFGCSTNSQNSQLVGTYKDNLGVSLNIENERHFRLEQTKSPLNLDKEPLTCTGYYEVEGDKLTLFCTESNEKPYEIYSAPKTYTNGYEILVKGEGFGRLKGVMCQIKSGKKVIHEIKSNQNGIVKFNYFSKARLVINLDRWEKLDVKIDSLKNKSLILLLKEKDYTQKFDQYTFKIKDSSLVSLHNVNNNSITLKREAKQ